MEGDMFLEENTFCSMIGHLEDRNPQTSDLVHPFLNVNKDSLLLYIHIAVLKSFYTVYILQKGVPLAITVALATGAFMWNIYITDFEGHSNLLTLWFSVVLYEIYHREPSPCAAFFFLVMNLVTVRTCEFVVDVFIAGTLPWMLALLPGLWMDLVGGGFYSRCLKLTNAVVLLCLYWILTSIHTEVMSVHLMMCVGYLIGVSVGLPDSVYYFLIYAFAMYTRVHVPHVCNS